VTIEEVKQNNIPYRKNANL